MEGRCAGKHPERGGSSGTASSVGRSTRKGRKQLWPTHNPFIPFLFPGRPCEEAVEASREMLFRSNGPIQGQVLAGAAAKMRIGGQFPPPSPLLCPSTDLCYCPRDEQNRISDMMTIGDLRSLSQPAVLHAVGQQGHPDVLRMGACPLPQTTTTTTAKTTAQTKSIKTTMHPITNTRIFL